ncbi:hypothetical protein EDD22DRAFT_940257 [Suillus occidentalis]|nr:hypothetical protein EDD22DRAFT_940257 [Suillus occidentalis]
MSPISLIHPRPIMNTAQPFVPSTTAASCTPSATPPRPFLTGGCGTLATPASNVFKPTQPHWQPKAGFSTASEYVKRHPGGPQKHASSNTAELKTQIHSLVKQNEVLRETVEEQCAEIDELKNTVNAQSTSLDKLLTLIKDHRTMDNLSPSTKSVDKATKAVCDNVFNAAVRHTFLHAMGISDSKQAATLAPLKEGAVVLCPNFAGSWMENVNWREDMIRYVRLKACEVYGQLREDHLKKKSDTDIAKQLKEVFDNTRDAIKKGGKGLDAVEVRNRKQ